MPQMGARAAAAAIASGAGPADHEEGSLPPLDEASYGDLLAAGVHETRRPLALAHGYVEMLRDGSLGRLNANQRKALERIDEKVAEARAQLERIHVISRLQRDSVEPVDLVLEDEVRQAVSRGAAKADLLGGQVHFSPGGPTRAHADRALLTQVLDNLVDNALTYTDSVPSACIEVDATPRPLVRVRDQGFGFSDVGAAHLFEAGFRAHPDDSRRPGSGFGLYLSRRAAERMGGTLRLEATRLGAGSTFVLLLRPALLPA